MTLHVLDDVPKHTELAQNYVIFASLNSERIDKLINRIPGSHILI